MGWGGLGKGTPRGHGGLRMSYVIQGITEITITSAREDSGSGERSRMVHPTKLQSAPVGDNHEPQTLC